jgi:hypothetical protein
MPGTRSYIAILGLCLIVGARIAHLIALHLADRRRRAEGSVEYAVAHQNEHIKRLWPATFRAIESVAFLGLGALASLPIAMLLQAGANK